MPTPATANLTINGVTCQIYVGPEGEDGGIEEIFEQDRQTATVVFKCNWKDRYKLVAGLVGTVNYKNGNVERTNPFYYPIPDADNRDKNNATGIFSNGMWCAGISRIKGIKWRTDVDKSVTGVVGWGYYDQALITAEFTAPPYLIETIQIADKAFTDPLGFSYITSKIRTSGEVFTPPVNSFVYGPPSKHAGLPLAPLTGGQIRVKSELSVTRWRLPLIPCGTFDPLIGTINNAPVKFGGRDFVTGAVMFSGYNTETRHDPYNWGIIYDIELLFLCNRFDQMTGAPLDWNLFMDPDGTYAPVFRKDGVTPVFPPKEFGALWGDALA